MFLRALSHINKMETHIMDRRQLMVKRIMVKVKPVRQDGQNEPVGQNGQVEPINSYYMVIFPKLTSVTRVPLVEPIKS